MKITTTTYIIRSATTKEPIQQVTNEEQAVNLAGLLNKKHNAEVAEVVKIIQTVETSVL